MSKTSFAWLSSFHFAGKAALNRYRASILLVFFSFLSVTAFAQDNVIKGIADLADEKFDQRISLNGEWEFYWKELIYRGGFKDREPDYFYFPSLWNDQQVDSQMLSSKGYATYRTLLILPDSMELTMHVEDMYSSFSLYLNGKIIAKNGDVGTHRQLYTPEWKPVFVPLKNLRDTNELVLQIANFDHCKGGARQEIEIGQASYMADEKLGMMVHDLMLTGSLFMGGLFFLGLYLFGRHDKAILYFSLFCITYSYRIIGVDFYILHSLVDISWYVAIRVEYIALFMSAFLFGRFIYYLYPEESKRSFWNVLNGICLLFTAITLFSTVSVFTHLVEPFFLVLMVYLVMTFVIYIRAKLHDRPGSSYALISTTVVFAVFFYDICVYLGLAEDLPSASFWGYVLFFFSQSLILSFRFADSLKRAKEAAEIASQAKTDFLSTISHEIRTPLNAVVGISHLMLQETPRKDQEENLLSLKYSAQHLTSLINDILDYNKMESGVVEFEEMEVDLKEMAESIHQGYRARAQEKDLEMKLEYDERIKVGIITDKTRLNQILTNLVDNAIKFTQKGHVILRVKRLEDSDETITVFYEVEDTGIGIPADKKELIFERFTQASSSTTREFGGTGLGLSIIKKLLELQGIEIRLKSDVGLGSTFFFEQQYKKGQPLRVQPNTIVEENVEQKLAGKKVLLVEDNPMNVMVVRKFLTRWGMEMDIAENGRVAVEKTAANVYDLILMDLQMPVMDGYQASREIRQMKNLVPIVALTASALLKVQEKVMMSGMNDYITKPFDPSELMQKLAKNIRT